MKRIFLTEGKRDVNFLRKFVGADGRVDNVTEFFGEEVEGIGKGDESRAIGNFLQPHNPYHVLLKSEEGYPNLVKVFGALLSNLHERGADFCLLIDLDGSELGKFERGVNEVCHGRFNADVGIQFDDYLLKRQRIVGANFSYIKKGQAVDDFRVVAFRDSLESAAGINGGEDSQVEDGKLEDLAQNSEMKEVINRTLLY